MSKIIFAAALLAILTLTIAIGVTTTQQANAVIDPNCTRHHSDEQCFGKDVAQTLKNLLRGLTSPDDNNNNGN